MAEKVKLSGFNIEDAFLDVEAINKGRWVPLGANLPGAEVQVTGISSTEAKAYMERLRREVPRAQRISGKISDAAEEKVFKKTILDKCLHDWRGLSSAGEPLAFSKEMAETFLNDPKARLIGQAIVEAVLDLDNTKISEDEEAAGN